MIHLIYDNLFSNNKDIVLIVYIYDIIPDLKVEIEIPCFRYYDWDLACLSFVLIRTCLVGSLPPSRRSRVGHRDIMRWAAFTVPV